MKNITSTKRLHSIHNIFQSNPVLTITLLLPFILYTAVSFMPLRGELKGFAKDIIYYTLPLIAAVFALRSLSQITSYANKLFVFSITAGTLLFVTAETTWLIQDLILPGGNVPYPSISDWIFISGYILMLISAASLVRFDKGEIIRRLRYLIDALILGLSVLLAVYFFILMPGIRQVKSISHYEEILITIYPLLDAFILCLLIISVAGFKKSFWEVTEVFFALFSGSFFVGDFLYNRLELGSGYDVTTFSSFRPDIFWMAGYSFLALSLWHLPIVAAQEKKNRLNTFKFSHDFSIRLVDVLSPTITLIFAPLYMYNAQFWYKTPTVYWMLISSSVAITFFTIFRTALLIVENKNLSQLALRDALTGLFNHRYFQEQLDRELNKAQRQNKPLSIVIMDIDDFAVLNNSYGHQLGDAVLMRFAKILNSMTRSYDTVARLGGDEFGIILPETDSYHAYLLVERIKEAIRESLIDFHSPVTFSAGIAAYPELGVKKEELLSKADNALYWAKYNNKDAVVAYQDTLDFLKPEERIEKIKEQAFLNTVKVLAAAVDARDQFTQFHSRNVSVLAAMLGKEMGLPREKIKLLEIAGLLHDVGKIGISDSILKKEGKLNESERAEIEQHPILAAKILNQSHPKKIVPWILHHHEHWDGKGYPFGLVGEEMPLEARILAICDAYDAMTAERHYRSGMTKEQALEEIQKEAGKQFDPELAKVFVNMMQEKNKQTEILKQNF